MRDSRLRAYIGYLGQSSSTRSARLVETLALLGELQRRMGVRGDLGQIGDLDVDGAGGLALLRHRRSERLLIRDLVVSDGLKASSRRDRRIELSDRLATWTADPSFGELGAPSSTTGERDVQCRLVHVAMGEDSTDLGGLLEIAVRSLSPDGVVVADGCFDSDRPGQSVACHRFLQEAGQLAPFLLAHGLVALCRPEHRPSYLRALASDDGPTGVADSQRFRRIDFYGEALMMASADKSGRKPAPAPDSAGDSGSPPLVLHMTPRDARNPYFADLPLELEQRGWPVAFIADPDEALDRLDIVGSGPAVAHFHQLEPFYDHGDPAVASRRAEDFLSFVDELRRRRVAIVHTLHNRRRHDRRYPKLDRLLSQAMCDRSNRVVVLGQAALEFALDLVSVDRLAIVRHPNYVESYGPLVPQDDARRALALPSDDFVFLMLGGLKPYKGHDLVLDAFSEAALTTGRLVIVGGGAPDATYVEHLESRADDFRGRVRLVAKPFDDEAVPLWLGAADVMALAFEDILMSGSVMLSLSYGVPVIVPDLGCLPEYVRPGVNGWLFDPGDSDSLANCMVEAATTLLPTPDAIIETVSNLGVEPIADELADVYRQAVAEVWAG